jgi:hypothetical protein
MGSFTKLPRIMDKLRRINFQALFRCRIQVQKHSVVEIGTGVKCWRQVRPSGGLISQWEHAPATSVAIGAPPLAKNCTENRPILPKQRRLHCLGPCKVLGQNRTKMFHVKHFGTIRAAKN